jgi:hypothetical protein
MVAMMGVKVVVITVTIKLHSTEERLECVHAHGVFTRCSSQSTCLKATACIMMTITFMQSGRTCRGHKIAGHKLPSIIFQLIT